LIGHGEGKGNNNKKKDTNERKERTKREKGQKENKSPTATSEVTAFGKSLLDAVNPKPKFNRVGEKQ